MPRPPSRRLFPLLGLPLALACSAGGGPSDGSGTGYAGDTGSSPMCGNGILESGEACEGMPLPTGCDPATCTAQPGYECSVAYDPGTQVVTSSCMHLALCGDGHLDPGEECDDGNHVLGDGCTPFCTKEMP